jgi:glycosyltransferase involved in cell wall biosynthesis
MRIGLLTTSFPRDERDIAGAFVLGFARALANNGHAIHVLAPEPRELLPAPSWPGLHTEHVAYLRPRALERTFYGAGVPDNLARDPLAWLGLIPFACRLTQVARSHARHWDAIVSHWALPCALAAGFARRGIPHLAVLHSADVHLLTRLPQRRALAKRIAHTAHALWFVSDEQRRKFLDLLPRAQPRPATWVCPMGVEPATACDRDRSLARCRYGLQGFSVLALGRLVPIKGLDTAIRACAALGITLILAGEGPERGRLARLAAELGADVRFLGNVVGHDKIELFRAVDAFVSPSRRMPDGRGEGLPNALLEALAHGVPSVVSRSGGVEELLGNSALARWVVAADDVTEWVSALATLHESIDERRAASEAGRAIVEPYAWPRVAAHAERLLANAPPRAQ